MPGRWLCPALLIAVLVASGCTPASDEGAAEDAARQSVEEAYLTYWDVLLDASDPADPEDERLSTVATGPQLQQDVAMLQERARSGQRVAGDYQHEISVVSVTEDVATVEDCLTAGITIVAEGAAPSAVPAGPYAVTASLVREDDRWLVSELEPRTTGCTSAAAPSSAPSTP